MWICRPVEPMTDVKGDGKLFLIGEPFSFTGVFSNLVLLPFAGSFEVYISFVACITVPTQT